MLDTVNIDCSLLQMLDLLFEYVDLSMTQFCPDKGKIEELEDYYMVSIHYVLFMIREIVLPCFTSQLSVMLNSHMFDSFPYQKHCPRF